MADGRCAQENRFELKYVVDEPTARLIREYARAYLAPDEHTDARNAAGYAVHSVYLDSLDFRLCKATMDGVKNRYKLRVRYYDENSDSPVFFEIKRRVGDATVKRRSAVRRQSVAQLLAGHWPEAGDLYNAGDLRALGSLKEFCELKDSMAAQGRVVVSYTREAYVSPDGGQSRLTFDREIAGLAWSGQLATGAMLEGTKPRIGGVVLELKFTDRFPDWMRLMARRFNLQRRSVPKYVQCALALFPGSLLVRERHAEAAI